MMCFIFKKPYENLDKFVEYFIASEKYHWFSASKDMGRYLPLDKSRLTKKPTRILYRPKTNEIENVYYDYTGQYISSNKFIC